MSEIQQSAIFFGTPVNFPSHTKIGLVRHLLGGKSQAYTVAAWWVHMRSLAKQGTTFGQFTTTTPMFVTLLGADVPEPHDPDFTPWVERQSAIWGAFDDAELIEIDGDTLRTDTTFRVSVNDFGQSNVSRKRVAATRNSDTERVARSNADRQALKRERERRRVAGEPSMSHEAVESFLATRATRHGNDTTRHDTRKGREGNLLGGVSHGGVSCRGDSCLICIAEQRQQADRDAATEALAGHSPMTDRDRRGLEEHQRQDGAA